MGDPSRGVLRLLIFFLHILFVRGGRLSHTILPSMIEIMTLGELQIGNPSEALALSARAKRGVILPGPDSYSCWPRSTESDGSLPLFAINHKSDIP